MPDAPGPADPIRLDSADALTATYRTYGAALVGYAARFTGDATSAHDVVQDVFVKLWEQRATLEVERSLQALLYTMTRNRALNVRRQSGRLDADAEVDDMPMKAPAPDEKVEAADLGVWLRRGIEALPPRRAEAFTLSRFHGLSHAEIARVMGLSIRTVDTHVVHALRDLRRHLDALTAVAPSAVAPSAVAPSAVAPSAPRP